MTSLEMSEHLGMTGDRHHDDSVHGCADRAHEHADRSICGATHSDEGNLVLALKNAKKTVCKRDGNVIDGRLALVVVAPSVARPSCHE